MPFPANLPPDAMKDVARWNAGQSAFLPRNLRSLNPDFYGQPGGYWGNPPLRRLSASKRNGVILTDGSKICTLETSGAVRGESLVTRNLGHVVNSGEGPTFDAISPDAKWVYLSGPYSAVSNYGHLFDTNFPPGRVYRAPLAGSEMLKEFLTILEGVKQVYVGLAPFSSAAESFGGNSCCVCRTPRFDMDRYGRLALPNCGA